TFGHDGWDFVGSYGLITASRHEAYPPGTLRHFDTWAFRAVGHPAAHSTPELRWLRFERGDPLLPVWSCFGGMGVYRMACLHAVEYDGGDCEHVVLHQRLRAAGFDRLFLNPSQVVLYERAGVRG